MSDTESLRKDAKRAYKVNDYAGAVECYAQIFALGDEASPDVVATDRRGYAAALMALNRIDEAAVQWELVIAHSPQDANLRQKLAGLLSRLGRHDDAIEQLTEATRLDSDVADHYWRLASEYRALGRDEECHAALKRCLELDPGNTHAQIMELELAYLTAPERDGQQAEAEVEATVSDEDAGPQAKAHTSISSRSRRRRWMIFAEALTLFVLGLWLRSFFS